MQRFLLIIALLIGCSDSSPSPKSPEGLKTVSPADAQAESKFSEETVNGILLHPTDVLDGKLSLLIPRDFSVMDEDTARLKYPNERRPPLVYTNDSASVNIAINHTQNRLSQRQLSEAQDAMVQAFKNLYPSATWFSNGITRINGRDWLLLDLRTPAIDTEIRNHIIGTSLDERLLLVSVNVTKKREEKWLKVAEAVIQSVHIND